MIIYEQSNIIKTLIKNIYAGTETTTNYPTCVIANCTPANYNWGCDNLFKICSSTFACTCSFLTGSSPNACAIISHSIHCCTHSANFCINNLFKYNDVYAMNFCTDIVISGFASFTNNTYYGLYDCQGCGYSIINCNAGSTPIEVTRCYKMIEFNYKKTENKIYICDFCTSPATVTSFCTSGWNIQSIRFQAGVSSGICGGSAGGRWGFKKIININPINNLYNEYANIM